MWRSAQQPVSVGLARPAGETPVDFRKVPVLWSLALTFYLLRTPPQNSSVVVESVFIYFSRRSQRAESGEVRRGPVEHGTR